MKEDSADGQRRGGNKWDFLLRFYPDVQQLTFGNHLQDIASNIHYNIEENYFCSLPFHISLHAATSGRRYHSLCVHICLAAFILLHFSVVL